MSNDQVARRDFLDGFIFSKTNYGFLVKVATSLLVEQYAYNWPLEPEELVSCFFMHCLEVRDLNLSHLSVGFFANYIRWTFRYTELYSQRVRQLKSWHYAPVYRAYYYPIQYIYVLTKEVVSEATRFLNHRGVDIELEDLIWNDRYPKNDRASKFRNRRQLLNHLHHFLEDVEFGFIDANSELRIDPKKWNELTFGFQVHVGQSRISVTRQEVNNLLIKSKRGEVCDQQYGALSVKPTSRNSCLYPSEERASGASHRLDGADLRGRDLSFLPTHKLSVVGALYNRQTIWPECFNPKRNGAIGPDIQQVEVYFREINSRVAFTFGPDATHEMIQSFIRTVRDSLRSSGASL